MPLLKENKEPLDILFLSVTNKDWFRLSLLTINHYLFNCNNIFVLQTKLDLSLFNDVTVCNLSIFQFMEREEVSLSVVIMELNMGFLDNVKANYIPITYEIIHNVYYQDHLKPQVVLKEKFLQLPKQEYEYPLTEYYKSIDRIGIPNYTLSVTTTIPICCKTKSLLKIKHYVKWNDKSFLSLKKYLNSK